MKLEVDVVSFVGQEQRKAFLTMSGTYTFKSMLDPRTPLKKVRQEFEREAVEAFTAELGRALSAEGIR